MIYHTTVNPVSVRIPTDDFPHADQSRRLFEITGTDEYKALRKSVNENGFLDPIVILSRPGSVRVELGEQRILLARELGVKSLEAIVLDISDGVNQIDGRRLHRLDEVCELFGTFTPGGPAPPGLQMVERYLLLGLVST